MHSNDRKEVKETLHAIEQHKRFLNILNTVHQRTLLMKAEEIAQLDYTLRSEIQLGLTDLTDMKLFMYDEISRLQEQLKNF